MKIIFVSFVLFLSVSALAQKTDSIDSVKVHDLNEVMIIGDKANNIPGSGQYINNKKLDQLNQINVNNVLRIIPGVNIRDEEGFGLRPNIGLRGTPVNRSAKITLMEDGILIAPASYADPSAYYFPTFARMHGVEVLKGSSQVKYGPYTIGGAVNLLSTKIPDSFKAFAQVGFGSFYSNQQRLWIGDSRKNIDYLFEVNRLASKGFKELDNGGNTGFDRRDIVGKIRWHTSENAKIAQSLLLKFVNSTEDSKETYLGLTYEDYQQNARRRYSATQKDILDLNHKHISLTHTIVPSKSFSVNTSVYYSSTFRDWARANTIGGQSINNILTSPATYQSAYQVMIGKANGNIDYQSAARTYYSKGIQTNAQYLFSSNTIMHKINFGIRFHTDQADRYATKSVYAMANNAMTLTSSGIKGNQENQIRNANSMATFLNYDFQYKNLKLSPGLRYEKINFDFQNFGNSDKDRIGTSLKEASNEINILLPGIGINYEINRLSSVFGGVHKGFSPPGMPSVTSTTTQAKAEQSLNYEVGYRLETDRWSAHLTGFLNNYTNILGSDNVSGGGAGSGDLFNAGNAKIKGLEVSGSLDLLSRNINGVKLTIYFAYTYTSAKFLETFINGGGDWGSGIIKANDLIPFITPHLLTASLGFENKKFNISFISRYTGATKVKPGQSENIVPKENIKYADVNAIDAFLITDISGNYRINKYISAYTTINNVFNNDAIVANLPQGYRPNMLLGINLGLKLNL